jgi:hypothetical protein
VTDAPVRQPAEPTRQAHPKADLSPRQSMSEPSEPGVESGRSESRGSLSLRVLSLLLSSPGRRQELPEFVHGPFRQLAEHVPQVLKQGDPAQRTQHDEGQQNGEPARPVVRAGEQVVLPPQSGASLLALDRLRRSPRMTRFCSPKMDRSPDQEC